MSSKSSTTSATETARETTANGTGAIAPEMSRQQFARAVDWMASGFRAAGELQQVNLQMGERAALLLHQAADNARKAGSPTELVQIQSTLMLYEWQEMTRYSQELMLAFARVATQPGNGAADSGANGSSKATAGLADAAIGAAAPMVQAWQQVFTGLVPDAVQAKH